MHLFSFYLFIVSCQYKAIPAKTVHADDAHMIISATQWRDEEFGAFCQVDMTGQKIKVWKRVGKLTVQPV